MRLLLVSLAFVVVRLATAAVVSQPGYTDSYYFVDVAARLAHGQGLTADFLWSPLEGGRDPASLSLPVPSHLFWVPLPTVLAAAGIVLFGGLLDTFGAAQVPFLAVAALIPATTFVAARGLGAGRRFALAAAVVAGCGGIFATGFVAVDAFAPAAVLGTAFFLLFRRAAGGDLAAGAAAGAVVGLLYLTRSEAALFGLALLALVVVPRARRAGLAGTLVALAIGGAWLARDLAAGLPPDLLARSALLVRYEDFFAYQPAYLGSAVSPTDLAGVKAGALLANALMFASAYAVFLLVPLGAGVRAFWSRADVRAWTALAVLLYLAESLVFTLHSTRGSYPHSLAAIFPYGVALAAAGGERVLAGRARPAAALWTLGVVALVAAASAEVVYAWDGANNAAARVRAAADEAIPAGPFLAIDAAAWRWIGGRPVAVTPADGLEAAACVAARIGARSVVLEAAHFSRYDALYRGDARPAWLGPPVEHGDVHIYPVTGDLACAGSAR